MEKALGMFTVLLVALAMTGVAVSHWSDNVQVQGIVHMGDFKVGWRNIIDNRDSDMSQSPPKEVASLLCTLEDPEDSVHHTPPVTIYHRLVVQIENAYPNYWATCWLNLKNAGTVPAHIVEYKITPGPGLEIGENLYSPWDGYLNGWRLDNADTHLPVMIVRLARAVWIDGIWFEKYSLISTQIDPCNEVEAHLFIRMIQDGAEECHTYTFDVEVLAVQWNMAWEWGFDHYPPPGND